LASPEYAAVIGDVPTGSEVVVQAAIFEEVTAIAAQPETVVPPEVKVTVPVGVGGPAGEIVAVRVTDAPRVAGLRLEARLVVEAAWFTTCDKAAPVLVR
jgi:hypothetical protein